MKQRLLAQVKRHEGLRLFPYKDSQGVLTIGYGHNLEKGISNAQAEALLDIDLTYALYDADYLVPSFDELNEVRQAALANMAFNLGSPRLSKFKKMLAAIDAQNWDLAAAEALNSRWASQVGKRAQEIAFMLQTGEWPVQDQKEIV